MLVFRGVVKPYPDIARSPLPRSRPHSPDVDVDAEWSGIVLAAGRGSRMGDATQDQPKCLTVLGGRSLLAWQQHALERAGIRRLFVIAGYRGDLLRGRFERLHNERWASTSMVGTLACAAERLRCSPCIVSYSDIVFHPEHVTALMACRDDIAITYDELWQALWSDRFADPLRDAETFSQADGRVLAIGRRATSLSEIGGQFMGLLRITPAGWSIIEEVRGGLTADERDRQDMTGLLALLAARGVRVGAVPVRGRWCEVDSQSDLALYEERLRAAEIAPAPWSHDWRDG